MSSPFEDTIQSQEEKLAALVERGVKIVDPRQTYVADEVDPHRIHRGVVLHPGTRLVGAKTLLAPGASVGTEGPATIKDAVLGEKASVASGYLEGAVLLDRAKAGAQAHFRPGTLLEEQASTAHCVGLKQTILLSFVTLGSLINFCDCLMAGGTSRKDHSEVGSGYIHFNYTPWGEHGDKATPSLIGDVRRGVFLREPRIFLGGSGGMIGPRSVEYGAIAGAGQVLRKDIATNTLSIQTLRELEREMKPGYLDAAGPRARRNVQYIGQLVALRAWYRQVRLARAPEGWRLEVIAAAIELIEGAIAERHKRLRSFLEERGKSLPDLDLRGLPRAPWALSPSTASHDDHLAWVEGLSNDEIATGQRWLTDVADVTAKRLSGP